jgi:hypothetical protein
MAEKEKKSEINKLFPTAKGIDYEIKPWSLGNLADLSNVLGSLILKVREEEIKIDDLDKKIPEMITWVLPYAPEIIAKTLNLDLKEVRDFPIDKATQIIITIISQNLEHLKNSFGLVDLMNPGRDNSSGP